MAGHGFLGDRDGFFEEVGVSPVVALRLELLLILADLCEAEAFPEDHLLRVERFSVGLVTEERLVDEFVVVVLVALEGEDYLLVVYALGVLYVRQVGKALPRSLGSVGRLGPAVLPALVAGDVGAVGQRGLRIEVGLALRDLALEVDLICKRVQHLGDVRED